MVVRLLKRLCAPVRDELVETLSNEKDVVELFKGLFELVEHMRVDMANFAVRQNRGTIESYSEQIEREEFMKVLSIDKGMDPLSVNLSPPSDASNATKEWLKRMLTDFLSKTASQSPRKELSRADVTEILINFYITLLESHRVGETFPETFKLDEHRVLGLGEKLLQLILTTAAGFIASNHAGKEVCEGTDFKVKLKTEIILILNDVEWR